MKCCWCGRAISASRAENARKRGEEPRYDRDGCATQRWRWIERRKAEGKTEAEIAVLLSVRKPRKRRAKKVRWDGNGGEPTLQAIPLHDPPRYRTIPEGVAIQDADAVVETRVVTRAEAERILGTLNADAPEPAASPSLWHDADQLRAAVLADLEADDGTN